MKEVVQKYACEKLQKEEGLSQLEKRSNGTLCTSALGEGTPYKADGK